MPSSIGSNVSGARSDDELRLALLAGLNKSVRHLCGLTCQYIFRAAEILGTWHELAQGMHACRSL